MDLRKELGVARSVAIYYLKPLNHRRLKRFYSQFISAGDLCFDVGAHLGNRTHAWHAMGARVVAVDPQPRCLQYLHRKFDKKDRVTIVEAAVGEKPGRAQLHVSKLTPTITSLADAKWQQAIQDKSSFEVRWDERIEVEVVTLDQLIQQYGMPHFIKIDVEDLEYQVLLGLSQPIPALSFEYFAPTVDRAIACINRLEMLDTYCYNWSFGESLRFEAQEWLEASEVLSFLEKVTPEDRSGDIYARRK